jgi:hypothetical protein
MARTLYAIRSLSAFRRDGIPVDTTVDEFVCRVSDLLKAFWDAPNNAWSILVAPTVTVLQEMWTWNFSGTDGSLRKVDKLNYGGNFCLHQFASRCPDATTASLVLVSPLLGPGGVSSVEMTQGWENQIIPDLSNPADLQILLAQNVTVTFAYSLEGQNRVTDSFGNLCDAYIIASNRLDGSYRAVVRHGKIMGLALAYKLPEAASAYQLVFVRPTSWTPEFRGMCHVDKEDVTLVDLPVMQQQRLEISPGITASVALQDHPEVPLPARDATVEAFVGASLGYFQKFRADPQVLSTMLSTESFSERPLHLTLSPRRGDEKLCCRHQFTVALPQVVESLTASLSNGNMRLVEVRHEWGRLAPLHKVTVTFECTSTFMYDANVVDTAVADVCYHPVQFAFTYQLHQDEPQYSPESMRLIGGAHTSVGKRTIIQDQETFFVDLTDSDALSPSSPSPP